MGVKHTTQSILADDPASEISSGEWNADHTIDDNSVAPAKLAVSATDKVIGRSTAGAGAGEEIPLTAAGRALIDDADAAAQRTTLGAEAAGAGAAAVTGHEAAADPHVGYQRESDKDANSGYPGLAAAQGTRDGTKFLRDDGTWQAAAGGSLTDHTHAATGSGANGGGGTLSPATLNVPANAVATAAIANDAVTYAKMQNVSATDRILGRDTAAAGDVEELTVAQVMAMNPNPTINVYNASNTWTKPAGARFVRVRVVGCGGGSGGAATTVAGERAVSGGGAGGGYAEKVFAASALGATETITIGAAGAAGAAGNNNGGTGGTCSFGAAGTLVSATGGAGGSGAAASGVATTGNAGGDGGVGSGGDLNAYGDDGGTGYATGTGGQSAGGNYGGGTRLGGSRRAGVSGAAALAGRVYGGGASGVTQPASTTQIAGAAGALGVVIVETYY